MQVGNRVYFNQHGQVIHVELEYEGDVTSRQEDEVISYIDLKFGDKTIENAEQWHVDVNTKKIVVDKVKVRLETEEDKLRREKQELENQLLIAENKTLGGIL